MYVPISFSLNFGPLQSVINFGDSIFSQWSTVCHGFLSNWLVYAKRRHRHRYNKGSSQAEEKDNIVKAAIQSPKPLKHISFPRCHIVCVCVSVGMFAFCLPRPSPRISIYFRGIFVYGSLHNKSFWKGIDNVPLMYATSPAVVLDVSGSSCSCRHFLFASTFCFLFVICCPISVTLKMWFYNTKVRLTCNSFVL